MARADKDMQLVRLAADIKKTYLEERRQFYLRTRGSDVGYAPNSAAIAAWDGGRDARGVRHSSAWEGIAKFAVQHHVDPVSLVRAAFEMCNGSDPPLPNMIKSQRALDALQHVQDFRVEEMKHRFAAYANEAETAFLLWRKTRKVSDEQVWKEVISSPELVFTSLFRFVLASGLKLTQAMEFWRREAANEYIRAPHLYDEVLGGAIPADFREEAARIRKLINRG